MVHDLIRVFPSDATSFDTNGLGALIEATKCIVTEEANGSFELQLEYPVWGRRYNDLILRNLIVAKSNPFGSPQAFRIYALSKPMNGIVTYSAQHISYDLNGYPIEPFDADSCAGAMAGLKTNSLKSHNFTFWTDKTTTAEFTFADPLTIRSVLGGREGSILDVYRGEYEFDNFVVKLHNKRGTDRGVTIRYGKDMTDFNQEENISNVYTSVYPYWKGKDDDDNDIKVELSEKFVPVETNYNFVNVSIQDFSSEFETAPSESELREFTKSWIKNNSVGKPDVSFEVSYVQLSKSLEYENMALIEEIGLFDTVSVEFTEIGVSAKASVSKTEYDAIKDQYETITLGSIRASISDSVVGNSQSIEDSERKTTSHLQKAIENATKWITNGKGYMVAVQDEVGNWKEICSLDEPSIERAKSVWRWNNGGFGHSDTGYNGPYRTAITQDGHIVADFIDTGDLTANVITTGILKDSVNDTFYLDLDAGSLRMRPSELYIGGINIDTKFSDIDKTFDDLEDNVDQMIADAKAYADEIVGEANTAQDEELKAAIGNAMLQENIFKALTDNGKIEGLFMREGQLYVSGSYIYGGVMVVGGNNNVSGVLKVRNAAGQDLITFNNQGITLSSGCKIQWSDISGTDGVANKSDIPTESSIVSTVTKNRGTIITKDYISSLKVIAGAVEAGTVTGSSISGSTISGGSISGTTLSGSTVSGNTITGGTMSGTAITVGGVNNTSGIIYVKDASGKNLITLNKDGISLASNVKIGWGNISGTEGIAKKTDIPTNVSQLNNDASYAKTSSLPTKLSQLADDIGLAKDSDVPSDDDIVDLLMDKRTTIIDEKYIASLKVVAGSVLSGTVTSCTITGSTISSSTITVGGNDNTNGAIYVKNASNQTLITLDKSGITLSSGCKIQWSDISGTGDVAYKSNIPTKLSQLNNDVSYAKTSQIPTSTSQLTNNSGYITSSSVPTKLSQLNNDVGYATGTIPSDDDIVELLIAERGTIITKEYIASLKVVAGSVVSGSVSGSTITGGSIESTTITSSTINSSTIYSGELSISGGEIWVGDSKISIGSSNTDYSISDPDSPWSNIDVSCIVIDGGGSIYLGGGSTVDIDISSGFTRMSSNVEVWGSLRAKGGTIGISTYQRINPISTLGTKLTYSTTSTSSVVTDIGEGQTDEGGYCSIYIDEILSEIGNSNVEYQVFLQKEGPGDIWVGEKNPIYFTVKGTPNLKFSWEIKMKQRGEETYRMDEDISEAVESDKPEDPESILLSEYGKEVTNIQNELVSLMEKQQLSELSMEEVLLNGTN